MKPYKIAMAIIMMAVTVNTFGQSMTYNHDASKMGQIQVMELGAGVLTPDLYYSITHSGYKKELSLPHPSKTLCVWPQI